jgi:hypothetical protein
MQVSGARPARTSSSLISGTAAAGSKSTSFPELTSATRSVIAAISENCERLRGGGRRFCFVAI